MKKLKLILLLLVTITSLKAQNVIYLAGYNSLGQFVGNTNAIPQVVNDGLFSSLASKPTTLSGYGITDGASTSGLIYNVLSKTANYTILTTDFNTAFLKKLVLSVDATSGNITITLPTVVSGYEIDIIKTDASANTVTVSGITGDSIISQRYVSRNIINNGTNWFNY